MLKKIRVTIAALSFLIVTLLFLDFTGTIHLWFGWMAKIQFLPAVLAINVGVVLSLITLTLLFGRVYCSVICPLGIMQDIISWISGKRKGKKLRFTYSPQLKWLRYGFLVLFLVALVAGIGSVAALLAPYSSYGRIASNLFAPVYAWGNNILAYFAERADSYAFYEKEIWLKSLPTFIIATVTFIIIAVLSWKNGRTYCNTVCPVGTVLGFLSKFSLFRPVINREKCKACGLCAKKCKASCIDSKNEKIDYSRCVTCFNCIENCKQGAISYTMKRDRAAKAEAISPKATQNSADNSRRTFLTGAGVLIGAAAAKAQETKVDGGLAVILDKKVPKRTTPIVPPGAGSLKHFRQHCTGCQLCVSVCPNNVLRPSTDLTSMMQPESSYERGYCRPECTKCSEVCPTGAIKKIAKEDKSSTQIGHTVWIKKNCIPVTDGVKCGNCARHCPVGAIKMVALSPDNKELRIPVVNEERCIGCGACENLCPARPFSAIYVEGHEVHKIN